MANLLKLHEAIAIVLLSRENRKANIDEIADEINRRKLFIRPSDGENVPSYQVMQRTKLSSGKYSHLFEFIEPDKVKLRNL
jgi:predicted transcriptional regulator